MDLARRAWQASQPSEDEVRRAVRRIRVSTGSARRGAVRRLPALAAAALVLGGALAYAANGGYSALIGDGSGARQHTSPGVGYGAPAAPAADEPPSSGKNAASMPAAPPAVMPEAPAQPTPAPMAHALEPPPPAVPKAGAEASPATTGSSAQPSPSSAAGAPTNDGADRAASSRRKSEGSSESGWRQVGEALAAGDEARATRALNGLAHDSDPETRAKAELGLARLAASSGNCERARRLALSVARRPGVDDKLVERAHDVVLRCEGR
jgi:hypothetical protein